MLLWGFSIVELGIFGALAGVFLLQLYFYARYLAAPARRIRREKKSAVSSQQSESAEGVSVILCAHNEAYNLSQYLQALLTQDYPEYEVIVVDDGSEDETRNVVEYYMAGDPRLHLTFVPYGARVGSTKKLALTLAAKAAKYDYLLLTDADCVPESNHWISEMMRGFECSAVGSQPSDIVLGFSPYFETRGHVNRLIRFDTLFTGLHYLGAALCGHPYMGVGRNLAYRKSLFFESGGFTHMMNNRAGDDDLFVNHLATKRNTAAVVSRESYVWSLPKETFKEWWQQKRRHVSVSPAYRPGTKFRLALEPLTRGLFYALVLLTAIGYGLSVIVHPLILLAAAGLFMLRWIIQSSIINISARRMGLRRFTMFTILWFDIVLPLMNLWMLAIPKKQTKW